MSGITRHSIDPDAELAELGGEVLDVGVLGAAAQDLVADDQDAGGDGFAGWDSCPLGSLGHFNSLGMALLPPASGAKYAVMSSPRDIPDDSVDYWRRDERTIKLHGPGRLRRHAPGRPPGGRDARLHHAVRRAGRHHRRARQALSRLHPRPQGDPRPARLSRLSRSRSAPRSTTSSATASRATSGCRTATSSTSTSPPSSTAGTATPPACSSPARSA